MAGLGKGDYAATIENMTEAAVMQYIQQQKEESKRDDTRKSFFERQISMSALEMLAF